MTSMGDSPLGGNGEPSIKMTVRELIELYGQQTVAEVRSLKTQVERLDRKVQELDRKVNDLDAGDRAQSAILNRGDRVEDQRTQRHGQVVAIVGIALSLTIGLANMITFLVISHG